MRNAATVCSLAAGTILLTFAIASPVQAEIELPPSRRVERMEAQNQWSVLYSNFFAVMDGIESRAIYSSFVYPDYPVPVYPVISGITGMLATRGSLLLNPEHFHVYRTEPSGAEPFRPGQVGYTPHAYAGTNTGYRLRTFGPTGAIVDWTRYPSASWTVALEDDGGPSGLSAPAIGSRPFAPTDHIDASALPLRRIVESSSTSEPTAFASPTIDGAIHVMFEHRGALMIGGRFDHVGTQPITSLAEWRDGSWRASTAPLDANDHVYAMCTLNGNLVIGVTKLGDQLLSHRVLMASSSGWIQLGSALPESPRSFAVLNGELFVGLRTALVIWGQSPLYRLKSGAWESCGAPPGDIIVNIRDMVAFEDRLYVGGSFLDDMEPHIINAPEGTPPGPFSRGIRSWKNGIWRSVGDDLISEQAPLMALVPYSIHGVHDLAVYHDKLYATGNFVQESTGIAGIASWDGTRWHPLPSVGVGYRLVIHNDQLVPVGILAHDFGNSTPEYRLAGWNGEQWSALESEAAHVTRTDPVAVAAASFEGELVLARDSTWGKRSEVPVTPSLSAWNGSRWRSLIPGDAPGSRIDAMLELNGKLVVGGQFDYVGGQPAHLVATWDGESWSTLGAGLDPTPRSWHGVKTLGQYRGELVAGGEFYSAANPDIAGIARWNGSEWLALGDRSEGLWREEESYPYTLVVAMTAYQGKLTVAGSFTRVGNELANGLASWNGDAWDLSVPGAQKITTLVVYENQLYASGDFTEIGGVFTSGVVRWNGVEWRSVPGASEITAMLVHDGSLFLFGMLEDDEGTVAKGVGRWDGSRLSFVGACTPSPGPPPPQFISHHGILYFGGQFRVIDGVDVSGLAMWNGANWRAAPHEGGSSLATFNDRLYVSYEFEYWRTLNETLLHSYQLPAATSAPPADRPGSGSRILSASPNPFNPSTTIEFTLAVSGDVTLDLYDVAGRRVRRLESRRLSPGTHSFNWNGRDDTGKTVASGVYNAVLRTPDGRDVRRITLLK